MFSMITGSNFDVLQMFPILIRIFALEHLKINVVRFQPRFGLVHRSKLDNSHPISWYSLPVRF